MSVVDTQVVDQPLPLLLSQESMQFLKAMPLKAVRAFWGWLDVLQSACCRGSLSFQNIQVQVIAVGKGQYLYCLNERHAHLVYLDRCVSLERVTARIRPSKQQLSMVAQYHADLQALKNAVQDVLSSQDRPQQQVIVSDVNVPQQAKVQGGHGGITAGVFTVSDGRSVRYLRKVTNCVEVSAYYAFRSNPKLAPYIPQLYRTEIVAQRSQQRVCVQLIEDAAGLAALEQAEAVALKQPIAKRGKDKHKARILMEDLLDGANPDDFYIVDLKLFVLDGEGEWGHIRDDAEGRANLGHGKGGFNRLLMDLQPRLAQIEGAPGLVTRGDKLTRQFQFLESSRIFYTEVLEHLQLSELQDLVKQILDMMQGLSDKQTSAIGSSFFFIVHKRGAVGAKMRFIDFGHFLDNDNLNIAPAELQRLHDGFLNGIRLVLKAVLKMVFKRVVERYLGQQYVEQLVFFGSDAVRRETQAAMLRLQTAVCRSERIPATVLSCVTSLVPYLVQDDPAHGLLSRDEVCCAEADSLLTEMQAHMRRSSFFDAFPQLHADEAQTLQVAGVDLPG
ncbi:MAG: hypothetical protein A3J38_05730 [Gammaproteobacteria bacterium RIFCSPHIGHO2_12_FULL_45_9]|nr:MAG: hypothetical protein A3J38_05730 [Gammaproteobacteria bacterium RIFCSPHIGHO2_12_FULL_45_9]